MLQLTFHSEVIHFFDKTTKKNLTTFAYSYDLLDEMVLHSTLCNHCYSLWL